MTPSDVGFHIRQATEDDIPAIYDICLRTADAGKDGNHLFGSPLLPGYLWSVAYAKLEPDFAFVLDNGECAIGYVIGTPDSQSFRNRLDAEWWPWVRKQIKGFTPSRPRDEMALARIAKPESGRPAIEADYPAHLHINILPEAQAAGWGKRMIKTELQAMRAHGVRGLHLGVMPDNARAMGFYEHLGFHEVTRDGSVVFAIKLTS